MKIVSRSQFWRLTGLLVADSILFATTDPQEVPSLVLIVGFLLFTATAYCLIRAFLTALSVYGVLPSSSHRRRLARVITGLFAGLVALQSIGQLSSRDVLVLLPLTIMAYLYVTYGKTVKTTPKTAVIN